MIHRHEVHVVFVSSDPRQRVIEIHILVEGHHEQVKKLASERAPRASIKQIRTDRDREITPLRMHESVPPLTFQDLPRGTL